MSSRTLAVSRRVSIAFVVAALLAAVAPPTAVAQSPEVPAITVDPAEVVSVQGPDAQVTRELAIGDTGAADLRWRVYEEDGEQLRRPIGPATPVHPVAPAPTGPATFRSFPGPPRVLEPPQPAIPPGQVRLTHSGRQAIRTGNAVACAPTPGAVTTATGYLRHYTLADFGIASGFDVSSVSFGVEGFHGDPHQVSVNLYTVADPTGPFGYDNFDLIGTAQTTLNDTQSLSLISVPVTGTAPAGSTLVVEVAAPDMVDAGFRLAATPTGQSAPSYLRAVACGVPEPADTAALGLPGVQLLLNVTGTAALNACDVPAGTPWVSVDPTSGLVAAGGSQVVELTFDSTGLALDDVREGELCLESNDPHRSLVVVPLRLEVAVFPSIEVAPAALDAQQRPGEVTEQTLSISNHGDGQLGWTIEQAPVACDTPAGVPWLAAEPASGQTDPGGSDLVTVSFDSTGLSQGDFAALLCVASNDPEQPVVEVPVTLAVRGVACDRTITGVYPAPLTVTEGVTCLAPDSRVEGQVNVLDGAGLVATASMVQGPLSTFGATVVEITGTSITGPVSIRGTTVSAALSGNQVIGSVFVVENRTSEGAMVISANMIVGSLLCSFNQPAPVDSGGPNDVIGGMKLDQCAGL